ncbi:MULTISPECIES: hypothetical protein [unclassified Imperialibacter]|uniref:hypothetical protein n=1 Tax=unclassified Imperialibacter TaxID=2629706 RepID=UPI0012584173|nr:MULTISPECIES: hypothetical protein [unclassified Imperialibacter]CAD5290559.1 conserved hypothetical protein [Imperialibacter sp. 89]CAD5290832.1 conserved hypothetical protein [Imperialibacter sp. 75]VVT34450.1 conserved hypothetical protein [Imperialibacter sp. EC-SDR9]
MAHIPAATDSEASSNLTRFAKLNFVAKTVYQSNPENPPKAFMDISSKEVKAFLQSLYDHEVKYMLVGGIATVYHGFVRTTQDLDLWVQEVPENKQRLVNALKAIDVAGAENYLTVPMIPGRSTISIGDDRFVADFMGYTKAFKPEDFEACYAKARKGHFDETPITVIHINDLIKEKTLCGRPKDLLDVTELEMIKKNKA